MTAPMPDTSILCRWDGEAMHPAGPYWATQADAQWTVGERYTVEIRQERSAASHRAYFAALNEAHGNLPDDLMERFPTVDHMRRYALIRTGHRDERSIIASSKAEARRVAAFVRPMDEFAVVSVHDCAVVVWTAKSQSMRAMGKATFQRSKDDVLGFVAEMIGVAPEALSRAGCAA